MVWVQIDPFTTVNACLKKLLLPCVCCFLSHTAKTLQNHNWSVPVMFIGQQQHCKQIMHLLTYCHRKSASVRAHKLMILFLKGNQYYYQVERVSVHRNAYCSIDCLLDFFSQPETPAFKLQLCTSVHLSFRELKASDKDTTGSSAGLGVFKPLQ